MDLFERMTDEELVKSAQAGNTEATDYLLEKYKSRVRQKANALFLLGGDTDDLIQEGMIGLFKALRDYEPEKEAAFKSFADLCISRQMYTAIEAAARKKHGPLNSYVSLSSDSEERQAFSYEGKIASPVVLDPQELVIHREDIETLYESIRNSLSKMELEVLEGHLAGLNYHQIGERLGKTEKTIDNALQRIKKKVQNLRK